MGIAVALQRRVHISISEQWNEIIAPLVAASVMVILVRFARDVLPAGQALLFRLPELALLAGASYTAIMLTFGRRQIIPVAGMARLLLTRE